MLLLTVGAGKCIGLWLALDDATEENGCLQFINGSHKWGLQRWYERVDSSGPGGKVLEYRGWPEYCTDKLDGDYVKVPVKAGSLVAIHGLVVHKR